MFHPDFALLARRLPAEPHSDRRDPWTTDFMNLFRPDLGWHFAERVARLRQPVVISKRGPLIWVFRAYLQCCRPGFPFPTGSMAVLARAVAIGRDPAELSMRAILNAALIVKGVTIPEVAGALEMSQDVVEAYEFLFFPVITRRAEATFLRELVYPQSRLVELAPDYLATESLPRLLLRIGYNKGLDEVLYAAGMRTDASSEMSAAQAGQIFRSEVMSAGLRLVEVGCLNHSGAQHPLIRMTVDMITTLRKSAPATNCFGPGEPQTFADFIAKEMEMAGRAEAV